MTITRTLVLIFCCTIGAIAQQKQLDIARTTQPIKMDGLLDDDAWKSVAKAEDFWLNAPTDDVPAKNKTEVFATFDSKNLYIAARIFGGNRFVIQSLKRDSDPELSDSFGVLLDPIGQKNLGYSFAVNVGGAQTEAMVSAVQGTFVESVDKSWDARWYSAVKQLPDGWSVEMMIPLKSIRFKEGKNTWGINFWRVDRQANEMHVWQKVPVQFAPTDLGFTGTLSWEAAPVRNGVNISVTPYVLGQARKDFEASAKTDYDMAAGVEAKVGLTPTLNLDLTANPDFSQTDVDQQVTNLSRFNIFFPERRQFFLENADVFTNFGSFPDAPFFSRRIGLSPGGQKVPILYGARLSGNLNPWWRVGVLNMQTKSQDGASAQNYSAFALHRRVLARSSVRAIFLNRQELHSSAPTADYSRNATGEFEYLSNDGRWTGKVGYSHAMKENVSNDNQYITVGGGYNGRLLQVNTELQRMGDQYSADMGFLSRLNNYDPATEKVIPIGYSYSSTMIDYSIFPANRKIIRHWMGTENYVWWLNTGSFNEWYNRVRYFIFFRSTAQLRFRYNTNHLELLFPFSLTDGAPLPVGRYQFREGNIQFNTDLRRKLYQEFFAVYGTFYNGYKTTIRTALNVRMQPWGLFGLGFEMNDIQLPDPYGSERFWLVNPKMEINFSNSLFWTTFYQYNTQAENFNINSRLQWRYRPMSDLFLVYSDNYTTDLPIGPKNRTLVLKLNYYFQF